MFLPSHLHTGYGSDQKVPAPAPQHWSWAQHTQCDVSILAQNGARTLLLTRLDKDKVDRFGTL